MFLTIPFEDTYGYYGDWQLTDLSTAEEIAEFRRTHAKRLTNPALFSQIWERWACMAEPIERGMKHTLVEYDQVMEVLLSHTNIDLDIVRMILAYSVTGVCLAHARAHIHSHV